MSVDKHTLQKWVAGAELRLAKTSRPFAKVPFVNRIKKVAESKRAYTLVEKIDLTRARLVPVVEAAPVDDDDCGQMLST